MQHAFYFLHEIFVHIEVHPERNLERQMISRYCVHPVTEN